VAYGTVTPVIDPLNGTLIKTLNRLDKDNYADWSIQTNLQTGDVIYGDRTNTFTAIPDAMKGLEWIRTACDSKAMTSDVATFTAGKAISVFVGLETRVTTIPTWLSGWTDTKATITASNSVTYEIYQKDYSEGATVTLGSNGASSGVIMYTVFVAPKDTVSFSTVKYGDVYIDGSVDVKDLSYLAKYIAGMLEMDAQQTLNADVYYDITVSVKDLSKLAKFISGEAVTLGP
jgi:rhamnogalacturonan endolyase